MPTRCCCPPRNSFWERSANAPSFIRSSSADGRSRARGLGRWPAQLPNIYGLVSVSITSYSGFQLRVQERGAFGVRRALAALVFTQRKAARARRTPNAPRRRAAYPFRKGYKLLITAVAFR